MKTNVVLVVLSLGLLAACGGSKSSTPVAPTVVVPTTPEFARLSLSISPTPVLATATGDPNFPWQFSITVTVNETAGLGANINRASISYRDVTSDTEFGGGTINPNDLINCCGGNFIAASGSKVIRYTSGRYRGSFGGKQLIVTVAVEAIDAKGHTVTTSANVNVLSGRVVEGPSL